jgi:DNA-binding transcriptional LysR family regulator
MGRSAVIRTRYHGHEALMQGTEPWQLMSNGKAATVRVHGRFKADNGVALAAAAVAGLGIAALPDFLTGADITSGALVPVLADHPLPEASLFVLRPPGDFPQRKVRALIGRLRRP